MEDPGIEQILDTDLARVRDSVTSLENGVSQDDHENGWSEAFMAASDLAEAADDLTERIAQEMRKRGID